MRTLSCVYDTWFSGKLLNATFKNGSHDKQLSTSSATEQDLKKLEIEIFYISPLLKNHFSRGEHRLIADGP